MPSCLPAALPQFHFYIALDCEADAAPGARDENEWIEIVEGVALDDVRAMVGSGQLNTPHSLLAALALSYLDGQRGAAAK